MNNRVMLIENCTNRYCKCEKKSFRCTFCGWNQDEKNRRLDFLKETGFESAFKRDADGNKRFIGFPKRKQ